MNWTVDNLPLTFKFILGDNVDGSEEKEVFHGVIKSDSTIKVLWKGEDGIESVDYNIRSVVDYLNNKDWIMEG